MLRGVTDPMACVNEAIVKIHSSINLGYVRNSPSPQGVGWPGRKTAQRVVHDPGLSLDSPFLVVGKWMPCANHRLELEDD